MINSTKSWEILITRGASRDPLYEPFVKALIASGEHHQLEKSVLTPADRQKQRELAERILEELRGKQAE